MAANVSDFLVERLGQWGVRRLFGYSGDGINGLVGALQRAQGRMEFVGVAHEEQAGLMACAHAKYTGEVGVCFATSGPGALHLLNGLYDARLDHQPVVALVGQQMRSALGGHFQQDVDLATVFKDVARAYCETLHTPVQARHLLDRAVRIALAERTVTCLILPHDVQTEPAVPTPPHAHGTLHSSLDFTRPRTLPREADLRRAAEVLNAGKRVAMLVGAGALEATDEVLEVAEVLGAGVAKSLLGQAALPDDAPGVTGNLGWLGSAPSREMMRRCDTLLLVGTGCPYTQSFPEEGQARGVQVDLAGRMLGLRYPVEVALEGEAAETLRALLPHLRRQGERGWREGLEAQVRAWRERMAQRASESARPLNPHRVFAELSARLPEGCLLAADSGTAVVWLARQVRLRRGMKFSVSGTLATMGCGVPYALAAKFAYPERPAVALVGDGAMQMSGSSALLTLARAWRRWKDPRFVVLVLNNRDLGYVTWEQRVMEGEPRFPATQDLLDYPYAASARLLGLEGLRVDAPEQVGPAWDQALAADRPVVLEAVVDPTVPPLPPELTEEQAGKLEQALAAGDPEAERVREMLAREGLLPRQAAQA